MGTFLSPMDDWTVAIERASIDWRSPAAPRRSGEDTNRLEDIVFCLRAGGIRGEAGRLTRQTCPLRRDSGRLR